MRLFWEFSNFLLRYHTSTIWVEILSAFTWGKSESDERRTFSGLRSQWTIFFECKCLRATRICVTKNRVILSDKRPRSLDKIISNMSPLSFSMTTKIRSGVSNIRSKLTTPGWCKFCKMETSFFKAASCLVGNLFFSMTCKIQSESLKREAFEGMRNQFFSCLKERSGNVRLVESGKLGGHLRLLRYKWRSGESTLRSQKNTSPPIIKQVSQFWFSYFQFLSQCLFIFSVLTSFSLKFNFFP